MFLANWRHFRSIWSSSTLFAWHFRIIMFLEWWKYFPYFLSTWTLLHHHFLKCFKRSSRGNKRLPHRILLLCWRSFYFCQTIMVIYHCAGMFFSSVTCCFLALMEAENIRWLSGRQSCSDTYFTWCCDNIALHAVSLFICHQEATECSFIHVESQSETCLWFFILE